MRLIVGDSHPAHWTPVGKMPIESYVKSNSCWSSGLGVTNGAGKCGGARSEVGKDWTDEKSAIRTRLADIVSTA